MTELTITPKVSDKTARFKGTIAAGEHVAVTIKGGAEWIGTDSGANLTLRVLDLVTGRTLAVFPYWTEDNSEDWPDDVTSADAWETSGDDNADLACTLNLNTLRMVAAARHMLRVPVMFVLGDTDDPRTLYFRDRYDVEYWPERIGDTVPYDLDKWPKQIDEWAEQVAAWTSRMDNLALDAERVDGGVKITLNDGTLDEPKEVTVYDGEVSRNEMNTAIAAMGSTKQNTLTFDAIPTNGSNNPVKSGGVYDAVKEVADDVTEHVGNTDIHVLASQKVAWTAKYAKPSGGIPASDLAGEIGKAKLTSSVQGSLDKADTAVQPDALAAYIKDAEYDSDEKKILLKNGSTTIAYIDATAFIKDGMVSSVAVSNGNLVITFNSDAGKQPISIPLTQVFNPSNYYDKTAADGRFVQKEAGKGLVAVDATLATQGAAADAKAVGDALRSGFTEWVFSDGLEHSLSIEEDDGEWRYSLDDFIYSMEAFASDTDALSALSLTFIGDDTITATRHLITPTKTSQLTNDGAPNGGGNAYVMTNDTRLSDARTPTAHHATHAANGSDPLAPADIGAAAATDLPYRLVEPGKWEYEPSVQLTNFEVTSSPVYNSSDADPWSVTYYSEETGNETLQAPGGADALSLDFGTFTATRPSLPDHLCDRAGNRVVVSGDTTLTLPAAITGYLRDFLVRLEISGSTVPTITFAAPTGETITYETDGDEFPVPDEAGDWLYSFTESCVANKFAVSLKKVNTVAQGGS